MRVRWPATVRSPRKSAAATSRFVRPSATSTATRRSAAVSPSSRVRPPIRPSSSRASLDPGRRSELLEAGERGLDRLAAGALLPCAPEHDAEREQRASPSERIADLLVLRDRLLEERRRPSSTSPCAAATRPRQRVTCASTRVAAEPRRVRLPEVEDADRLVDPAELEQRLDVVGRPRARVRRAPPERRRLPVGLAEAVDGRRRVSAPERDESRHRLRAGADGSRSAPRRASGLAPTPARRARAARDGRRST